MLESKSRAQYGSIDTSNTNIRPLVTILWQNTQEQQNVTHLLPYLIEMFIATYGRTAHLYILECSTVQCSPAVEEEEESSRPCVEWEVPRELLLHRDHLMPPLVIGFERFEENIWKIQEGRVVEYLNAMTARAPCGANNMKN